MYGSAMLYVFFTSKVTVPYSDVSERCLNETPVGSADPYLDYMLFVSRVTETYSEVSERCLNELPAGAARLSLRASIRCENRSW